MSSTARRLLVATPDAPRPELLPDRRVHDRAHAGGGAGRGAEPRRPTRPLDDAVPEWCDLAAEPRVAFVGGPVQPHEAVIALGRGRGDSEPADGWYPLLDRSAPSTSGVAGRRRTRRSRRSGCSRGTPPGARVSSTASSPSTAGTSSTPSADDLLTDDPDTLWRRVLRRQGGELAMAANYPLDPGTN